MQSSMFVPLSQMTDSTLTNDYHFLEKIQQDQRAGKRLLRDLGCSSSLDSAKSMMMMNNRKKTKTKMMNDSMNGYVQNHDPSNNNSTDTAKTNTTLMMMDQPSLVLLQNQIPSKMNEDTVNTQQQEQGQHVQDEAQLSKQKTYTINKAKSTSSTASALYVQNKDEILLDDSCFIPSQQQQQQSSTIVPVMTHTPSSAVKLDTIHDDTYDDTYDTISKDEKDTALSNVFTIVPKNTCTLETSITTSNALLQQGHNHNKNSNTNSSIITTTTSAANLHLTSNKDWLLRYPSYLQRLVDHAQRFCHINLLLMPVGMQRRTYNKDTMYDLKRKGIVWGRIEYIFHFFITEPQDLGPDTTISSSSSSSSSSNHKNQHHTKIMLTLEKIPDSTTIYSTIVTLLNQHLSPLGTHYTTIDSSSRNILKFFCRNSSTSCCNTNHQRQGHDENKVVEDDDDDKPNNVHHEIKEEVVGYSYLPKKDIHVLMKKIPCKASNPKFIPLQYTSNKTTTLRESLKETTIIEYPTLEIVLEKDLHHFPRLIEVCEPIPKEP